MKGFVFVFVLVFVFVVVFVCVLVIDVYMCVLAKFHNLFTNCLETDGRTEARKQNVTGNGIMSCTGCTSQ